MWEWPNRNQENAKKEFVVHFKLRVDYEASEVHIIQFAVYKHISNVKLNERIF